METYIKSLNSVFLFRMRTATLVTALCVFMLAAGAANAVTYTDSSPQTTAGQNFIFTFSPVNPWNGGSGTFTVHARGDYSVGTSSEYLDWDIDGLVSDRAAPSAGGTVIQTFNSNDIEWEQSFTINDGLLNAITSDSSIAISIDLSSAVGYQIDPSKHFVEVELTYNSSGPPCLPPPAPDNPDPCDGATWVPIDTCLAWNIAGCSVSCDLLNGGFETGAFSPWITITGPGDQLTPWSVTRGGGPFGNGFPFEGTFFAQNGFDGDAGLFYDIYQEIAIPSCASSAVLNWSERIQWDLVPYGATIAREYVVSVQPAGGGSPLAVLYAMELLPGTNGDTGYVSHSIDLLSVAPGIAGQTVRINFHEYIPETYTGPAQFDLDGVSLNCGGTTPSITGNSLLAQQAGTLDSAALQAKYSRLREAALASQSVEPGLDEYDSSAMNFIGVQASQVERVLSTGCFTFGGAGESWSGDSRLRANIITMDAPQTLSEIKMELSFSGSRDLYFYVFESSTMAGPYTRVLEKIVPTVGIGRTFYSSGPTNFVLDPGRYYGIGVAWGAGSSVMYYRNLATLPVPWALGMVEGWLYSDEGPPYAGPISNALDFAIYSSVLCFTSEPPPSPCPTTWDVYLGTDPGGMVLVGNNLADPNYCPGGLETGETYFWQVIAKNPSGETPGNVWSFETEGGDPPECNNAVPSVAEIWSPRHEWVDIEILDVNDPDGDPVSITITGITQDEPVAGHGSGRTSPDGMGVGTSVAHVRAERSGQSGNGRVYEISFEADDGTGNTCNGSVKVCVPHDQGQGHECVDDGQLYDSTATEMFRADLNGDGIIDLLDFNILANYWLVSYELED